MPLCVAKIGMQTKKKGRGEICETLLFPFASGFVPGGTGTIYLCGKWLVKVQDGALQEQGLKRSL